MATPPSILKAILLLMSISLLQACGHEGSDHNQASTMPPMPVSVLEMQATHVPIENEVVAQTEGAKEIEIRPRVGGIVIKKLYNEGASIKAGQPMFQIDPEPFKIALTQANAQLAQQQARIEQTEREMNRLKNLLELKSISQREYDNAVSEHAMAKAALQQYEAAVREAQLNLNYTQVTAPESGTAGRFLLSEGALVNANTSLLTSVTQLSPIWVRFSLSDYELQKLGGHLTENNAKKITLVLPNGQVYPEVGKLNFSASTIDPALGTQQLRAEFKNTDHALLPGQFVRVRVTTGDRKGVYLVPQTAVLTGEHGRFVYVAEKDKDGTLVATPHTISDAGWYENQWVVIGGLNEGDRVITDNLIKLRPNAPIQIHSAVAADQKAGAIPSSK